MSPMSNLQFLRIVLLSAAIGSFGATPFLRAQRTAPPPPGRIEVTLQPNAVMTSPLGTLESIHGSIPCSNTFGSTLSVNLGIGLRGAWLLDPLASPGTVGLRSLGLSVSYDDLSSRFESSSEQAFNAFDPVQGRTLLVATRHEALYTLSYLRTAFDVEIGLGGGGLSLRGGPSVSLPLSGSVREHEEILSPSTASFLDRTQDREIPEGSGTIDDLSMRIGIALSLGYRLPLGRSIFFEPMIGADIGVTSVQPSWSPFVIRGGIGIGWAPQPSVEAPPPIDTPIVVITPPPVKDIPFTAELQMDVVVDRLPIEFRRQIVARYIPLLPLVFFEMDKEGIPSRYNTGTSSVNVERLGTSAEEAHLQSLAIFGERLKESPRTRVTITGTTSQDESNRSELAQRRAEAVAEYFRTTWGVPAGRITLRSRIDPALPSNSSYPEGREENRRVELEFSDDAIYTPVQLRSVEPITEPGTIAFKIGARSGLGIDRWRADVKADGTSLSSVEGTGAPPEEATWRLSNSDRERVLSSSSISYSITVYDSVNRSVASAPKSLPVRRDTTVSVTTSAARPEDKAEFLLVTFDFDRAELSRRGREELKTVLSRIGPTSTISIVGYTDPIGETARNRTLAEARARNVAEQMPKGTPVEYRGAPPDEAPYSKETPAGRFLSRTVRVVVTNPR